MNIQTNKIRRVALSHQRDSALVYHIYMVRSVQECLYRAKDTDNPQVRKSYLRMARSVARTARHNYEQYLTTL